MIFDILNELSGKEVILQPALNCLKKLLPNVVIFEVLNDHVGKEVSAH